MRLLSLIMAALLALTLTNGQLSNFEWKKCDNMGSSGPSFDVKEVTRGAGALQVVGTPDASIVEGTVTFNVRRSFFGFEATTVLEREVDLCSLTECPMKADEEVTITRRREGDGMRRPPPGKYIVTMEMYGVTSEGDEKSKLACVEMEFQISTMSYLMNTMFGTSRGLEETDMEEVANRYLKGTNAKYSKEKLAVLEKEVGCNTNFCRQSPIDLISDAGIPIPYKFGGNGSFIDLSYLNEILSLKRGPNYLSYTLRRGFKPAILSINGQEYSLKNIHFHTPSEHTIDGVRFPAEAHFVHEAIGPATSAKAGGKKKYAVMGIFLDDGGLSSNFDNLLGSLLSDEAPIRKQGELDEIAALGVDTSALQSFDFKQDYLGSGEVFYYPGSLTTPPYSSDVSWMVVPKPVSVKSPLMKGMTALGVDNARPVQTSVANSEVLKLVRSN